MTVTLWPQNRSEGYISLLIHSPSPCIFASPVVNGDPEHLSYMRGVYSLEEQPALNRSSQAVTTQLHFTKDRATECGRRKLVWRNGAFIL